MRKVWDSIGELYPYQITYFFGWVCLALSLWQPMFGFAALYLFVSSRIEKVEHKVDLICRAFVTIANGAQETKKSNSDSTES